MFEGGCSSPTGGKFGVQGHGQSVDPLLTFILTPIRWYYNIYNIGKKIKINNRDQQLIKDNVRSMEQKIKASQTSTKPTIASAFYLTGITQLYFSRNFLCFLQKQKRSPTGSKIINFEVSQQLFTFNFIKNIYMVTFTALDPWSNNPHDRTIRSNYVCTSLINRHAATKHSFDMPGINRTTLPQLYSRK